MDARVMPTIKRPAKVPSSIMAALAYAVLEWILIFLLLIDASFSYLVTKFARYCRLQVPCLLCSRLDHILGKERSGFYWDLICHKHKLKVSSLVLCHLHSNLVDVHGMCESCLFSFATVNKSNAETYRLLVGKLGCEPHLGLDEDPLLDHHGVRSSSSRSCSCCNEQRISRGFGPQLFHAKSIQSEGAGLDESLSLIVGHDSNALNMARDETFRAGRVCPSSISNFDPLPHVEYKKVKITSDSDSEAVISDNERPSSPMHQEYTKKDATAQCMQPEPQIITLADEPVSEKFIHPASAPEHSLLEPELKLEGGETQSTVAGAVPIGHGLEELQWQHVEHKTDASASPELISFDDVLPSVHEVGGPVEASRETLDAKGEAELGTEEIKECGENCEVSSQSISTRELHLKPDTSEASLQIPHSFDLGDAYKIAVGSRGRQLSGRLLEQKSMKDSTRVSEDFKLLLSQLSASRGSEKSLTDMSPRVSGNIDELRAFDASSSVGMQILQKRISLERNESGLSLDGSTVSEMEGESVVDRLKRQVEHDKKLMGALYKELEEERNASAIAANQAMAMITRLQEEKAALHMEALQYLRMMEEQAEYDGEALQKTMDLLDEKEREIQDLKYELEHSKKIFGTASIFDDTVEPFIGELGTEDSNESCAKCNSSILNHSASNKHHMCNTMIESAKSFRDKNAEGNLVEFEEERIHLLQCLRKMSEKLQLYCPVETNLDICSADFSTEQSASEEIAQQGGQTHESHAQKGNALCDGESPAEEGSLSTHDDTEDGDKEGPVGTQRKQVGSTDLDALRYEFSSVRDRLEALETEISFLEHSFKSLRSEDDGLKCLQEIARQLQAIHSAISRRN